MERKGGVVRKEILVCVGLKEYRDHQAHPQEESLTLAEVGQPALTTSVPRKHLSCNVAETREKQL